MTDLRQASSSIGRAAVSKTAGWGFETLLACHSWKQRMLAERIKIAVAALIAVAGMVAFYALIDRQPLVVRILVLGGAFAAAVALMHFTENGRTFEAFARESWEEAKRVVWPTRKETLQTTGVVFLFVFVMALFLWAVDTGLLWITQKLLGQGS